MYEADLVHLEANSKNFDIAWQAAKRLSTDEKAELVEKLLEKEAQLIVVQANSNLVDYIIAQMSLLSVEGLTYILKAIASRIASDYLVSRS